MDELTVRSPAKINLFLEVLGERGDGYHQIITLMQAVDLCDELVLRKRKGGVTLSCDHPRCPSDKRNLAFKAASILLEEEKMKQGVGIHIKKEIPISAGLGGGSSNAAATLKGMNRLFGLQLSRERLHTLACQIGSDVPFFLYSGQALASGRGEQIEPAVLYTDYWLVIVFPGFEVSAGWAYQNAKISLTRKEKVVNYRILESNVGFYDALPHFENDLEEAVVRKHPVVREVKDALRRSGALKSSMSGSGPTVYGVFDQKPQAEEVARKLSRGDWQVFLTRPIPGSI